MCKIGVNYTFGRIFVWILRWNNLGLEIYLRGDFKLQVNIIEGALTVLFFQHLQKAMPNIIPNKVPKGFFRYWQTNYKFIYRGKRFRIGNLIWKRNNICGLTLPNFKNYYKNTIIKIVWYWWKIRSVEHSREHRIDSHKNSQLVVDKGARAIQ